MAFDSNQLIVEHHLGSLGAVGREDYVAHVLCTQGQFSFVLNGKTFSLKAGEAMIIPLQQLVERVEAHADGAEVTCIYVKNQFVALCTPRSNYGIRGALALYTCPVMQPDAQRFERLRNDFAQIEQRLGETGNPFQEDVLISVTQLMFLDFFDIHADRNGHVGITSQDTDMVARFMQLLERGDYVKRREVSYYADKLCITPKYLSEVCKGVSGRTANYWITRFTVNHIRRLLTERDMTFTQIADLFAFSSPSYFSHFVQKHLGALPSSFRE